MKDTYFEMICSEMSKLPEVIAITLAGSRAGNRYDEKLDYDMYIYCTTVPSEKIRQTLFEKTCQYSEIGNTFWELEDNCTLKNGIDIDILYRNLDEFEQKLVDVVEMYQPSNGYTTSIWYNIMNSIILYDAQEKFKTMQQRFNVSYPDTLKENIISRNRKLLQGYLPSYDFQCKKAMERGDLPSINHRIAAFMESYFDIIFAMNDFAHPGEKRMLSIAKEELHSLPRNFEENINKLYSNLFQNFEETQKTLVEIIKELDAVLAKNSQ